MKKVAIIGSSIAGASAALLLSKNFEVKVYEQKQFKEIGNKLCGNLCTEVFSETIKRFGLNPKKFIKNRYRKAFFHSANNELTLPTKEFEVDRKKFVEALIKEAKKNGVEFNFGVKLEEINEGRFNQLIFRKGKKQITEQPDFIIGADGALSVVAKKAELYEKGQFLALQLVVNKKDLKKVKVSPGEYHVFVGDKLGHFAYVIPCGNKFKIGLLDFKGRDVMGEFRNLLRMLGVKKSSGIRGAMIPLPKVKKWKKNIFLIGDAGGYQKFSGGGIIPALLSAEGLSERVISNNVKRLNSVKRKVFLNRIATKYTRKMKDADWDRFLEILKSRKQDRLLARRDWFKFRDIVKLASPKMFFFGVKMLLMR